MYLVYQLDETVEKEFAGLTIDLQNLVGLGENKKPLAISMKQLMRAKKK
jgi:hypothetical protein